MRIIFFVNIILIVFTISCNSGEEKPPIDKEKLVQILVDVHIAEAAVQDYSGLQKDSIGKVYYKQLFSLHHVTEKDFYRSMYLIKQDPENLEALYKEVLTELEKREKEAQ